MKRLLLAVACLAVSMAPANAAPVFWTDWTSAPDSTTVLGTLTVGSASVGVTYSGSYSFAQTSGGTNYWIPTAPYISTAVDNAPPDSDIIALNLGGKKTITFSQAIKDPLIALNSWNGNTVDFGVPIEILSFGAGYWGSGTPILNSTGTGFFGSGEVHGVIRLPGIYTSITFNDTDENWHGITVGVSDVAPVVGVPEPASMTLLGLGVAGLFGYRARRRMAAAV